MEDVYAGVGPFGCSPLRLRRFSKPKLLNYTKEADGENSLEATDDSELRCQ